MDVVGSEIGQKMRSAIKAKLTELGCYVDDELPDYVMVMVANKRTRAQMEDDLQLFLGDNTELFVNWLHQVLKKLQEVTVTPSKTDTEKTKEKKEKKEKKSKEKKEKDKTKLKKSETTKKSKKKDKIKEKLKKKEDRKAHKSKKKSKHHGMIRPNVPPLLMNIEKESEPSITDAFAGQILKNHGVLIETTKEEKEVEQKPVIQDTKRSILPIIDPSTITTTTEPTTMEPTVTEITATTEKTTETTDVSSQPRDEQIKEINEIEAKIQGLKQKLAEQLDSMSDDEDFLNIRTEAEELMNDFAEDVFQEISAQTSVSTPPLQSKRNPTPPPIAPTVSEPTPSKEPETLPHIELKLPKRPVRDRLGAPSKKVPEASTKEKEDKRIESPERFTPEREPDFWGKLKPAKQRFGEPSEREPHKRISVSEESEKSDSSIKKLSSRVSSSLSRLRCASVVRVRPRVRTQPASTLLLRAVADAHKSLLNIPSKIDQEPQMVKRALVLPMRRTVDNQKIVIQIPADRNSEVDSDDDKHSKSDVDKEEYVPTLTKKIVNTDYVPSRRPERTTSRRDDTLIIETLNIHNTTVGKDKGTQFIVTMDGFNPNAFLEKKLKTEGLLEDDDMTEKPKESTSVLKIAKSVLKINEIDKTKEREEEISSTDNAKEIEEKSGEIIGEKKRLSDTSDESDTQVIIKNATMEETSQDRAVKRKSTEEQMVQKENEPSPPQVKKRKASPIVFDVPKKEKEKKEDSSKKEKEVKDTEIGEKKAVKEDIKPRERTESVSSDSHVVSTTPKTHKYDSLPSLTTMKPAAGAEGGAPAAAWCRVFPACRWGARCVFLHPRCRFAAACSRRACPYSHARNAPNTPPPQIASHVVPAANYKSISNTLPSICKFYPNCANPACHFYHPKPCRYGPACINKLECNFYHSDVPAKFRYPV